MSLRDGRSKVGTCSTKSTNYIYGETRLRRNLGITEICLSWEKNLAVQMSWNPNDPY